MRAAPGSSRLEACAPRERRQGGGATMAQGERFNRRQKRTTESPMGRDAARSGTESAWMGHIWGFWCYSVRLSATECNWR